MIASIKVLRWIIRLGFLIALILGVALWTGHGSAYLQIHIWIGFIITFSLLLLLVLSLVSRVKPALPIISLFWAVALPVIGIAQLRLMPGASHWIIQVIHLIIGVGAVGLAEVLSKRALLNQRIP